MNTGNHLLFLVHKLILMYKNRQGIDTGRHMFEGNTVFFKGLQNLSAETDFGVHHVLFNIYRAEALLAGNTRDNIFGFLAGAAHNPCTFICGSIGIPDIDGNALLTDRENGIFMQNGCAHIGKLAEFLVGDNFNDLRILDNTGICN